MSWQDALERTVIGMGYELVDVEKGAGGLLRVSIDLPTDAGRALTVDDCEAVTRQLQHVLEVEGGSYERLEVSSPGLDRPLKRAADYTRFAGEQVEITLKAPFQGRKRWKGELRAGEAENAYRLVLADPERKPPSRTALKKAEKAGTTVTPPTDKVLDFSLDEVREARLVPVVDFKGQRFAAPAPSNEEVEGDTTR